MKKNILILVLGLAVCALILAAMYFLGWALLAMGIDLVDEAGAGGVGDAVWNGFFAFLAVGIVGQGFYSLFFPQEEDEKADEGDDEEKKESAES